MSETPWTPGPWEVVEPFGRHEFRIWSSDGSLLVTVEDAKNVPVVAAAPEMAAILTELDAEWEGNGAEDEVTIRVAALLARIRGEA